MSIFNILTLPHLKGVNGGNNGDSNNIGGSNAAGQEFRDQSEVKGDKVREFYTPKCTKWHPEQVSIGKIPLRFPFVPLTPFLALTSG